MYTYVRIRIYVHVALSVDVSVFRKLEDEEESYMFTSASTSAGEGSVLDIKTHYCQLQQNMRASAVRASKKFIKFQLKNFSAHKCYKIFCSLVHACVCIFLRFRIVLKNQSLPIVLIKLLCISHS